MDENTNQPSTTPLGNERRDNPGQTNIMFNSNGDSIVPTAPSWDENTPLEDIAKQYSGVGGKYNDLVENAADNVGDRQVQLVGNDFGATNPYMFNTYYEPSATAFASEMRMQGTQKALEEGLDRGEKEAQKRLSAAQSRYSNALAAAKQREEQRRQAKAHVSETDTSKIPEGVTEEEFQNYLKVTEGMSDEEKREYQRSLGIKEIQDEYKGAPINWDIKSKRKVASSATKKKFGITDEQWANMSQQQKDEFWARRDVGNYWTEQYMLNYFKSGSAAGEMMAENFQKMNTRADKVVEAINKNDFSDLKNYNTDLASIDVTAPDLATKFDNLRKTIEADEKYTPEQKSKYTEAINEYENAIRQVQYSTKQAKEIMSRGGIPSMNKENAELQLKNSVNNLVAAKNKAKEAFSDMSADEYGTLLADADSVTAKFSGLDDSKIDNNGADGYTSLRKKNELLSPYGLSFGDWQKLSQLKAEKPDDFEYLRDHTNFVLAGGGGAFEQITDGNKKYFINGKYWSANDEDSPISVGDVIFHSIDGTINEDGEYRDKDLKNFVKVYTDIYNGKRDYDDAAKKELTESYNQYAKRLSAAFYLGRRYGISLNENIYNVLLAQDGAGSETELTITNPSDPNTKISLAAAAKWFMSVDADKQAVAYAEIAKRARQSAGYIMMHDPETDQYYNAPLVQNGEDTIGQKGKMEYKSSNPGANTELAQQVANLSDEDCLALNIYLDNKIKDGTIDKGFLAYDGVPLGDVMVNSAVGAFEGFFQFIGWAGQSIAAFATGYDEKNERAIEAGKIWDSMSTIDANDDHNGDKDNVFNNRYTEAVRKQQADNLNHMVDTTFNIDYFDPSNEIDAKTGQVKNKKGEVQELTTNNYFDQYGWKNALNVGAGMVGYIAEFAAESALTAGVGKIVGTALKGVGKAIKATDAGSKFINGASRLLTANATPTGIKLAVNDIKASNTIQNIVKKVGSEEAVKSVLDGTKRGLQSALDDVARKGAEVAKEAATKADDAARIGEKAAEVAEKVSSTADNVAENIATKADDVAEGLADNVAEKAVEGAETAVKGEVDNVAESATQKLSKREITDLNKQLKEAKKTLQENAAIRYGLDATVDNVDDVAESFGKRLADKLINKWNDTNISKKLVASVRSNIDDGLAQAVQRAAINTRLASAAGISAERIAALPDTTAEILYGVLRASEENSDKLIDAIYVSSTMRRTTAAGRDVILGNIDFKKVAENIVEMSERAGTKYTLGIDDIFRSMATDMSTTPGKLMNSLRFSDFMRNRIADWSRDILQNYWTPELDKNFQSYYITPEQYFADPTQWGMGILFDAGTSMLKRGSSRLQLKWTNHKINEIMGNVDFTTANAADAAKMKKNLIKLDNLRNDAMKLNNKILDGKVSYKKVHEVAENAENAIQQHISHLTGDLDMVKSAELVTSQSAQAMEEAQTALAKGTRKGRREYHKILADADQINRIIIRGNDKLMAFQEVNAALQQVSITRYLDIDAHSKTIRKMTGKQWGAAVSDAFDELKDVDFAKVYGEADAKSFTGYTINVKDKEKAKAAYRVGQDLVYDTIYNKMTAIMGDSLTVSEKRELKAELNMLKERMIASGESIIDDGGKVRWNYFPTQALTWEAEPGSSSAVRALWGWDYKGGMHTGIAGEIANPELARDQWDIFKINQDYRNGQETFKRRRGDADKAREEGRTGKVNVDQFRDVQYNWEGYNPAYAVNAYLNSLDSAKYVSPLLDPINGIVVKNPEAALAVSKMSIRQMRAQESAINTKYDTMIAKKLEQKKTAKANRTSKKSLERRAKLVEDFSGSTEKVLSSDAQAKVSSIEANEVKVRRDTQKKIHNSPLVSTLADLYIRRGDVTGVEANRFAVNKLNESFNQLGNDIKAVRDMYCKDGKLKKKYLGKDGKVLPKYLDVEGNIVPENMTGTFAMDSATQYRRFVNQLANNKNLNTDIFDLDNHRIIKFDDGSQINAMAFQKELYDVLCTKQILDLGYNEAEGRKALELRKSMSGDTGFDPELVISKRLQPVEVDDVEARRTLTKGATDMLEQVYGTKNKFTGNYDLEPQMDTLIQDAVAKAWDDVEAHGGEINIYDFTREVDKHLPDFVKVGNKASTKELNDVMRLLRRYESAGGTNAELLADLRNAIDTETDPAKKATLTTAYNAVKQLDDYNNRTTNRAGLDKSLDEALDNRSGADSSRDEVLTRGDITADENLSGQQEGLANTYVPKGVDENLIGSADGDSVAEQSDVSLSDWMFTELNRHYSKPKYDDKTVSAIANKYLDKVTKAQTPDEITKVADEIASDLVTLDPEVKGSATELKHVTTDIKNAIHWLKESSNLPQVDLEAYPNMKNAPGQSAQAGASVETFKGNWTPIDVASSKDKVFLFGDNIEDAKTGYRPTSTQAVIRGEENAIGIPTKKNRGTSAASYFTDADFDEFKTGVDDAIAKAKASGKTIVLPENGIGTGAAQLEKRAPKCFEYLQSQLDALSSISQSTQSDVSLSDWMDAELNRHSSKRRYDSKTIASIAEKYQDRVIKAQTKEEIAKVSEDIAADLIPLDPSVKNSATEIRQAASDIQNAIFWSKQTAPTAAPQKVETIATANKPVTPAGQVSALAESLDIINANKDSNWAQRREYRNNRRQKFDALENQFNVISDILESKIVGKNVRTAYDILPANQVLTPETISKKFSDGNVTISKASAKKFDNYQKAYENASKKKTDAAKKRLIDSYKTLAESVNTDQAKAAQKARVEGGTGIYRGTHLLEGAKDRQVLALASGQHEVKWDPDYGQSVTYKSDGTIKSTYDKSVSHADVKNMLTAGTDGFGNIVFMDPKNIDEFIKKNNLKISDDLKKRIDAYKAAYAADSDYITAADHRYRVADSTVSMNDSFPEYLSSMNEVDANGNPTVHSLAEGGTGINDYRPESARYEAKNTFDDIEKAYKKAESDFYAANPDAPDFEEKMNIYNDALQKYNEAKKRDTREFTNKRVQKEIENAKGELDSVAYTADRGYGAQMQDTLILEPDDLYDFGDVDKATREVSAEIDRVSKDNPAVDTRKIRKANEEFDNVRKETEPKIKELGQKLSAASTEEMKSISKQIDDLRSQYRKEVDSIERDWYKNHRSEDSYWVTERVYELRDKFDKKEADLRKKLESVAPDEYKKLSEELNAEYDKINTARAKLVKELDSVNSKTDNKKLSELGDRFKSIDREKESIGRSSTSTDIEDYTEANDNPAYTPTYATPYADYLNATDHVNVSEESNKLNTLFYGNGDNTGFFDSMDKLAGEKNEAMGGIAIDFDESISDKLTELKKLDGAKDGEVITILEAAKQQADGIENKTVRDYINKRLDEEIDFAKKNLELKPGTSAKVRADFLNHDPEYKALKTRQKGMLAERGSKNAMYTPSGSHPVFIDGNVTPDGHYTLQQLLDARREVDLSRKKNGKNGFKSSKETRDILNSMRKDFNDGYDGSSLISSGAARQNDAWMLNLYSRVHESAGLDKLPKTPSFAEIEAGKMTAMVDGKEVEIALPLKMSDIYIDPQVAALGAHYWGEGKSTKVEMVYKAATALSNFSKAVQDIQLAGGVGQFNALTLRNAITMMWQDPVGGTRALFSNFHNARSNDSVVKFYLDNHEKLLKMAIDSGDFSTINGFVNVVNMRDEIGGRGAIQEFGKQVGEIPNVFKDKGLHHGFWGNASNLYEAIFQNPTFVRWMAVAKADMQIRNYDKATRFVNRIQAKYNLTDDDFRYVEGGMGSKDKYIATLAKLRTDRYWTPSEFAMSKGRAQTYLQRQSQDIMKRTSESLRGMPQKKTIRQCLSDFFFAIGYKLQMNAHPVSGIATIFTALPNSIRAGNQVANRKSFNLMSSRFSGRGNRNQALVMIGIAALAHIYNTYNGFPSAWEELWSDHGNPNNGTAGLPQTLMNFQDLGKIHIRKGNNPNDYYTADPFFSIFTLQNSAMRATNKAIFPNQIPYNTQRTFAQEDNQNLISRIQGVSDELIGANLLSGYKAIYEVLNNNTYFGNNIWEQPKLPNGEDNPNYNPLRNMIASVAHILNTEEWWFGTASNRWVKGLDIDAETWKDGKQVDPYTKGIFGKIGERGKYNGKTGTVAGSGIFQHEYVTALKHINDGEYFEALTESMELPFKSRNYEAKARTQLNTDVMMALRNARKEYDEKVKNATPDEKNQAYAAFAKKAVDIVHDWSAKNEYALGKNGELDATATKMLVSFMADEYDDVTNRIMNRYDKLRQDLKMADGDEFLFSTDAMNAAIADGMDDDVAAERHNTHLKALQEAYIKEYDARKALIEAGIDPDQFDTPDYIHDDLSAVDATFDKKTFKELTAAFNKPIGEFSNYEEMKNYYEELIANASTTKQKAKLANQYNKYITDVIAPYVGKGFAAQAFNDIYWDSKNLSNELGKYVIIPADKYYTGKSPRASYLKDLLGIGYRNNENLPSDKDITENIAKVNQALAKGQTSSAASLVDNALLQLRKGTLHASPEDRQKLIRMRALLSSRRK